MAYEVVMPYHLHMPSYFLETFTEYPKINGLLLEQVLFLNLIYKTSLVKPYPQ